ncbi:hypothetical protein GCM10010211_61940 [Streptomyces albospinus]|uniref:Uncharacterized protein n=1 Tax=Streptomyces albospinus TaxID=285515 RepID=A0ABQ2VHF8_9ACTN|nr:hypothetical protein [Streptomyces albospinus]GGU87302.1 hypothetical protein GCM10010211_61940 [Streptomyces albospinus]
MLLVEIRAEGLREREALVVAAHEQLAAHRTLAEAELRDDVASLAIELAGRIVGERLEDVAETRKTVSRFSAAARPSPVRRGNRPPTWTAARASAACPASTTTGTGATTR